MSQLAAYGEYRARVSEGWTIRPNLFFSLRASIARAPRTWGDAGTPSESYGAEAGLKGVYTPNVPYEVNSIQNSSGFGFQSLHAADPSTNTSAVTDLSWNKGKHNLKFGAEGFDIFNRKQWYGVSTNINNPTTFGTFGQSLYSRKIQFDTKLDW